MTAAAATEDPEEPSTALLSMAGARLQKLCAEASDLVAVRRILIAERAQQDNGPLCCTASFVDVGEDPDDRDTDAH